MNKDLLDLYTDYLICSTEQTTATQLSRMLDGDVSHDQVTRFLSNQSFTSKDLWKLVKPALRQVEADDGVLIFDDTINEKQWTYENEIICYHFDHSKGRSVKGINLLNLIYHHNNISLPLSFQIIEKPVSYCDLKTQQIKRESLITKRAFINLCQPNFAGFNYIVRTFLKVNIYSNDSLYPIRGKTLSIVSKLVAHICTVISSAYLPSDTLPWKCV